MSSIFASASFAQLKTHKEKLMALYHLLHQNVRGYGGANISNLNGNADMVKVKLNISSTDMKRF
jgi:hypothetical protein